MTRLTEVNRSIAQIIGRIAAIAAFPHVIASMFWCALTVRLRFRSTVGAESIFTRQLAFFLVRAFDSSSKIWLLATAAEIKGIITPPFVHERSLVNGILPCLRCINLELFLNEKVHFTPQDVNLSCEMVQGFMAANDAAFRTPTA
jgi:hypothetical protein